VSVIVPFAGPDLAPVLAALERVSLRPGDQILVANQGPAAAPPGRGGAIEVLDAAGPPSSYFARAVAAAHATAEWLVFTDADCVPDAGLLDAYFALAPGEKTAVLAGGIEDWVEEDTPVARYIASRRKLDQATTLAHPVRPYAQTANAAVRRAAFEAVGGFPDPVRSGGDADLCWRLRAAGWELEERPGARVRHRNRTTLRALLGQLHRHGSGMEWLERRYPGAFPRPRPRALVGHTRLLAAGASGALDFLALWAADLGRLKANGHPTPPGVRASGT
jgi:GT2 family glycosyltransferase